MQPAQVEFSRPLPADRVPRDGSVENIAADPKELAALATRLDVPVLHSLTAELRAEPWRGGGLRITGRFKADLDQDCVVSLDRFRDTVEGTVERIYLPQTAVATSEDDDADHLVDGIADLGELVTETLALALDPYPRKPGASFEGAEFGAESAPASFAGLAALRQRGGETKR
ncbi:MAG: DUF177 domain-containing protein [Rhizobiales bacterium]|nr:DUF177 domain-containing protein [Hyphomicrobiales bacterium]